MPLFQLGVVFLRCPYAGQKFLAEKSVSGNSGLKRNQPSQHLASIIPRNPVRRYRFCTLVDVQISGAVHTGATVRQVDCSFRVVREIREELLSYLYDFVGLATCRSHSSSKDHILALAIHAAKRIAWQSPRRSLPPSHDHSCVQSAGERNSDSAFI